MTTSNIIRGVGLVIDDEIYDQRSDISTIIKNLEKENIPLIKFEEIPTKKYQIHFSYISFVLLDWLLLTKEQATLKNDGINLPETVLKTNEDRSVKFLKELKNVCFIPVFIFTNQSTTSIKECLIENGLYNENKTNYIFIKSKSDIIRTNIQIEIETWIKNNPSIYILKEWEKSYKDAMNNMFWDFYNISPSWPKIILESFNSDDIDKENEMLDLIIKNISSRISPFTFDKELIMKSEYDYNKEDIQKVLEGIKYLNADNLKKDCSVTGDVFKIEDNYYLNIRPQCDLIRYKKEKTKEIIIFCIQGKIMTETEINEAYNKRYLLFNEKVDLAIVPFIDNRKTIQFDFNIFNSFKWEDIKDKRIGRLLPPYIVNVQQRFAFYIKRQGLPPIPNEAVKDESTKKQE